MKNVTDWSDITIGQYQEMNMIQTENTLSKWIETLGIAFEIDPQDIRDMPLAEYEQLSKKVAFLKTEPQSQIIKTFELEGKKFGLIPDMNTISTGLFLDAEQFKQDPMANLHYTIALIYRPIVSEDEWGYHLQKHQIDGFEERANLFKDNLSIEVVIGAVLFFSLLAMELSIDTLTSLEKGLKNQASQMKMKMTQTPMKKVKRKRSKSNGASTI